MGKCKGAALKLPDLILSETEINITLLIIWLLFIQQRHPCFSPTSVFQAVGFLDTLNASSLLLFFIDNYLKST